jgi:hypothetical protein
MKLMIDEPEITVPLYIMDKYTEDLVYVYGKLDPLSKLKDKKIINLLVNNKLTSLSSLFSDDYESNVSICGRLPEKILLVQTGVLGNHNNSLETPYKYDIKAYDYFVKSIVPNYKGEGFKRFKFTFTAEHTLNYLRYKYNTSAIDITTNILFYLNTIPVKTSDKIIGDNVYLEQVQKWSELENLDKLLNIYSSKRNTTTFRRDIFLKHIRIALAFIVVKDVAYNNKTSTDAGKKAWMDLTVTKILENLI